VLEREPAFDPKVRAAVSDVDTAGPRSNPRYLSSESLSEQAKGHKQTSGEPQHRLSIARERIVRNWSKATAR